MQRTKAGSEFKKNVFFLGETDERFTYTSTPFLINLHIYPGRSYYFHDGLSSHFRFRLGTCRVDYMLMEMFHFNKSTGPLRIYSFRLRMDHGFGIFLTV